MGHLMGIRSQRRLPFGGIKGVLKSYGKGIFDGHQQQMSKTYVLIIVQLGSSAQVSNADMMMKPFTL